MGCYNLKGFMSNITIGYGDDVAMFLAMYTPAAEKFYVCDEACPIALPIYGKYNDYGGLEDIVRDDNVKWLEENVGKIDDIISAFDESQSKYNSTIGECISSDNEYHPETKVRYVYGNLLKLSPHIDKNTKLCLLFEHKYLYEKWKVTEREYHNQVTFESQISQYKDEEEKIKKEVEARCKDEEVIKAVTEMRMQDFIVNAFRLFDNSRYFIFALYRHLNDNNAFILNHSKEIIDFEHFYMYAESIGKGFTVPMQYSQELYYDTQINYHKDCIDFINEKKKKYEEED